MTDQNTPAYRVIGGRYRLADALGSGAMGTVWSGYDELLHRPVAVKEVRLPEGMPDDEATALRERTLREARSIAVLNQQNVITVYDVVVTDAAPFVVMELIPGRSLAQLVRDGPLDRGQAASVADALAAALLAAHRTGITHRDVKPGNVLVGTNGQIKLTDFGIARNVSEATMTHTGIVLGSPAYIAPEVAAGKEVTPAADLWSLGATLFAAVCGRPPYDEDGDILATMHKVVSGEVPTPEVDGELAEVIGGLMVKDPYARMDLTEVRALVQPLLPAHGTSLFDLSTHATVAEHAQPPHRPSAPVLPAPAPAPQAGRAGNAEPAPLAGDPGPLPFTPTPSRARPSRLRGPVIAAAAVVTFFAAGTGTFVAARELGGPGVAAGAPSVAVDSVPASPVGKLQQRQGKAETLNGAQGGSFSIGIPRGWTDFVEQRNSQQLPPASVVHYVSPDGQREVSVERLPNFFPQFSVHNYFDSLREQWPQGDLTNPTMRTVKPGDGANEPQQEFVYRSVEASSPNASGGDLGRTTFGRVVPNGDDLWIVSVRVPTDQEDRGNTELFGPVIPTFRPSG